MCVHALDLHMYKDVHMHLNHVWCSLFLQSKFLAVGGGCTHKYMKEKEKGLWVLFFCGGGKNSASEWHMHIFRMALEAYHEGRSGFSHKHFA